MEDEARPTLIDVAELLWGIASGLEGIGSDFSGDGNEGDAEDKLNMEATFS